MKIFEQTQDGFELAEKSRISGKPVYVGRNVGIAKSLGVEAARETLGGGDIELFEMGVPAPVESGEIGNATVLVSMGNDTADKSLEELQGLVVPEETTPDTTADDT